MNIGFYLIVKADIDADLEVRGKPAVRMTVNKPTLKPNEVSVYMNMEMPEQLFIKPEIQATIVIDEPQESPIDVKTEAGIADAIKKQTGLEVTIKTEDGSEAW